MIMRIMSKLLLKGTLLLKGSQYGNINRRRTELAFLSGHIKKKRIPVKGGLHCPMSRQSTKHSQ